MNIQRPIKNIILLIISTILVSCASPARIELKPESMQHVTSTDVNIGLDQQEINAEIKNSNIAVYAGGGLIPALIDVAVNNSRAKNAEFSIQPIRDALLDYDFGKSFASKIESELASLDWLNVNKISLVHDTTSDNYIKIYSLSNASAVLFINTKYSFSADFKALKISSDVKLFPKTEELKSFAYSWNNERNPINDRHCLYKNILESSKSLGKEAATTEEAITFWAEDNALLVRQALDNGINELTKMIVWDLKAK